MSLCFISRYDLKRGYKELAPCDKIELITNSHELMGPSLVKSLGVKLKQVQLDVLRKKVLILVKGLYTEFHGNNFIFSFKTLFFLILKLDCHALPKQQVNANVTLKFENLVA